MGRETAGIGKPLPPIDCWRVGKKEERYVGSFSEIKMPGIVAVLIMSALLGAGSFGVALLPLSFSFSNNSIMKLSQIGTGLLLGAGLGVILPEGIEAMVDASSSDSSKSDIPTTSIALALLSGFAFMLLVEQFSDHVHEPHQNTHSTMQRNSFNMGRLSPTSAVTELDLDYRDQAINQTPQKAYPLTLGLIIHALADGFALGASALPTNGAKSDIGDTSELSLVVFFALLVHKAPASLALATSLLASPLSRSEIRRHLAIFASSTPFGAVTTYLLLSVLGPGAGAGWTGIALLFSAGTFLYVATVLQPVSSHGSESGDGTNKYVRMALIIAGMFVPHAIGRLVEHGHGHGRAHGVEIPGGVQVSS